MSRYHNGRKNGAYDEDSQSQSFPPEADTTTADDAPTVLERPPELVPHGQSPPFHTFVFILEALRDAKGMDKKRDKLARYFRLWREMVGNDLYPIIRMLIPERDRDRAVYGLKEQALAKCYIAAMGLDAKKNEGARRLTAWKQPTGIPHQVSGDFASVLYEVVNERAGVVESTLSIDEVHDLLDQLSKSSAFDARKEIIRKFYTQLEAKDQRWLVRIILKDLKITVREKSVLDIFHPDAQKLFDVCSDLKRVCYVLWNPESGLSKDGTEAQITLNRPLLPMLSARGSGDFVDAAKKMGSNFIIEEKLDGERINIHKRGDVFQYLSRKGKDYTSLYGKDKHSGTLTPIIASCFREDIADCILDGEMLAFDPGEQRCLPFGSVKSAAIGSGAGPDDPHPCFKAFDILYVRLHGKESRVLVDEPLFQRKRFLEGGHVNPITQQKTVGAITELYGRMEFPYRREEANSAGEIRDELDKVMERKGEGVILKKRNSRYVPNSRECIWLKIKPDYFDELGETCDLAVLGGYYGTARRGGRVSSLLCGLRVDDQVDKDGVPMFSTFVKVGGGFNLLDYDWMQKWHGEHWISFNRAKSDSWPRWILFASKGIEDKPDVWIHPDNSFIVSVKGAEVTKSESFGFGSTLRFPRAKTIRFDLMTREKMVHAGSHNVDVDKDIPYLTIRDWHTYHKEQGRKRTGESRMEGKRKTGRVGPKKSKLPSAFQGTNTDSIEVKTEIFASTMFLILTSAPGLPDQKTLQKLVVEHGGDFRVSLQNIDTKLKEDEVVLIVVKSKIAKSRPYESRPYDQVTPHWIVDSIKARRALPLFKKYLVHATEETKQDPAYDADPETYNSEGEDDDDSGTDDDEFEADPRKGANEAELLNLAVRKMELEESRKTDFKGNAWLEANGGAELSRAYEKEDLDDVKIERDWNEFDSGGEGSSGEGHGGSGDETEPDEIVERMPLQQDPPSESKPSALEPPASSLASATDEDVTMDYDEELFFKPWIFYLDLPEHAESNNLEKLVERWPSKSLRSLAPQLVEKGGTITTNLLDPRLSHVIMTSSEPERFKRIMQLTKSESRLRQIVSLKWLEQSLEEETLQAESDYRP